MAADSATETDGFAYVAMLDDFEGNDRIIVDVQGREIAVFNVDGEFHAVSNYCVHQGGPVCEGMLSGGLCADERKQLNYSYEEQLISCPWHGWEFDIETGEHLARPRYSLPTYDIIVHDDAVYLDV